ncbi:carbonic anhydrase 2 isoform X2 [Episyrphus balteatus]|uniref:carbonic anhydrase 2 isoform X2 n=1 Tax=Episyrphus balteatus TaxID=286459 RepID=UPI0024851A5D|nr:carbonic anhydrase 2 isoform X2 [Episyrphus balteatus]
MNLNVNLRTTNAQDFSYDGTMGPDHWGEQYNGCSGKYQSPINIDLLNVEQISFNDLQLKRFDEKPLSGDLLNNGHTVIVHLDYEDEEPTISGGPLNGTFRFAQLHFHWGDNDTYGSEDRINNQSFPAELHMVFYNTKYGDFDSAVGHSEGVAVLAFFYYLMEEDNPFYADLAFLLTSLQEPDRHVPFIGAPSLHNLGSTEYEKYFTYVGSLTTPPCSEEVIWIDFEEPVMISRSQLDSFRQLYTHDGELITHNNRPIQPLNGRIVQKNFVPYNPFGMGGNHVASAPIPNFINPGDTKPPPPKKNDSSFPQGQNHSHSIPFHAKRRNFSPTTTNIDLLWAVIVFVVFTIFY